MTASTPSTPTQPIKLDAGDRVASLVSGQWGTVRRVEGTDIRVRWDEPIAPGVTATWTAAHRLVVIR